MNESESRKAIFQAISKTESLERFNEVLADYRAKIDETLIHAVVEHEPPTTIPNSTEQAFFIRHKALLLKEDGWTDKRRRARWQNYWLSCCLSSKCDYLFSILAEDPFDVYPEKIDREKDILRLLRDEGFWEKGVAYPTGKSHYLKISLSYLLRRYSYRRAFHLWCKHRQFEFKWIFSFFSLTLPRLWGAIIVGMLFLMSGQEGWEKPTKLYEVSQATFWGLIALAIIIAFFYLSYECRKVTEYGQREISRRSGIIMGVGLVESAFISYIFVWRVLLPIQSEYYNFELNPWVTWGAFTVAAFLIGIFLQSFWEEKTIAEPL